MVASQKEPTRRSRAKTGPHDSARPGSEREDRAAWLALSDGSRNGPSPGVFTTAASAPDLAGKFRAIIRGSLSRLSLERHGTTNDTACSGYSAKAGQPGTYGRGRDARHHQAFAADIYKKSPSC